MKTLSTVLLIVMALLSTPQVFADENGSDDSAKGGVDEVVVDAVHGARIREGATTHTRIVGTLRHNTVVRVTGPMKGNWVPVEANGKSGYIYKDLLLDTVTGKTLTRSTEAGVICATGDCEVRRTVAKRNREDIEDVENRLPKPKLKKREVVEYNGGNEEPKPKRRARRVVDYSGTGKVSSPVNGRVNTIRGFQMVKDPLGFRKPYHHVGQDYYASRGAAVRAVLDGVIITKSDGCGNAARSSLHCGHGFGNYIEIRHPDGHITMYTHMLSSGACGSFAQLRVGEKVSAGSQIGCVGASGLATGPHLLFVVRSGGPAFTHYINPMNFLHGLGLRQ